MLPGWDLYYADSAHHLIATGWVVGDRDHDLSEVCKLGVIVRGGRSWLGMDEESAWDE